MAQIVTITNPLTGQPAQVDQLEHTAQQIDDAIARALPGGAIDITLANKLGGIESTEYPGCYYRMVSGVVEWFNPPMQLGVEYRTTERYQGKPVYTKLVYCGALPNARRKTVNHGATAEYMLRCAANCTAGYKDSLPYWYDDNDYCTAYSSTEQIIFKTPKDLSDRTANAQIWYTKPDT